MPAARAASMSAKRATPAAVSRTSRAGAARSAAVGTAASSSPSQWSWCRAVDEIAVAAGVVSWPARRHPPRRSSVHDTGRHGAGQWVTDRRPGLWGLGPARRRPVAARRVPESPTWEGTSEIRSGRFGSSPNALGFNPPAPPLICPAA